jgi:hypothetical protein
MDTFPPGGLCCVWHITWIFYEYFNEVKEMFGFRFLSSLVKKVILLGVLSPLLLLCSKKPLSVPIIHGD